MTLDRRHIRIFFIHFFIWALFYGFFLYPFFFEFRRIPPDLPIRLAWIIVLFYFNYFVLVPKLLLGKSTVVYIATCLAIILVSGIVINIAFPFQPEERLFRPRDENHNLGRFVRELFSMLNLSAPIFISGLLRMYVEWRKNEDLRQVVEKEKVSAELQFLKTQLNPHFLFNSLNAIYSLSVKNSSQTSETIISLSELMRYMLYEADKDKVPLGKEMEYIHNYVQLQRLRLSDSANVKLKISGNEQSKEVPPLLFISFIENAFKYGTDYTGKTYVNINLLIEPLNLRFKVENKIGVQRTHSKNSGVGLENIKNRLRLLYPNSHELNITDNGETYSVDLTLNL
ncbi:sensor histidine kinase [Flagellimonas zhangzhouensis]|uniref:Histidine kinase n=1 Tax=Flagellimonas zhangzhouensis TaxID=1073328 RepID=A0A1H2Y9K9_9FLAO|nr:histidine kinase [Allomuricauda zhangzhouensis]SDQ97925.1 Histidine kinase [Allomuricauda zhangzhouensis]SDX01922.1 Histidine kinase [Allomuricauda zhangzhouensis]